MRERDWPLGNQTGWKKMADNDDVDCRKPENPRTPDSSREGTPDWKETCIGVWSRSTKGRQVTEGEPDKICNGISFAVINKHTDPRKVKLSKTRGLQIVVRETEISVPPPKAHDHTYIRVEREEDDKLQKNDEGNRNSTDEQEPSLTRRVMDIMMMKKTNLEKNVQHYKAEGVKLTDVWNGFYGTCSRCYETTARLVSYCHPLEKVSQVFGFAGKCIKKAGGHLVGDDNNDKKK